MIASVRSATLVTIIAFSVGAAAASKANSRIRATAARTLSRRQNQSVQPRKRAAKTAAASGFMLKDAPPEEIAAAVQIVARGDALLAPAVTRAVIEEFARQQPATVGTPPPAVAELTPREHQVFELLARGMSNPEIYEQLVITEATAKTHVARILQKLDLRDRVQAVIYAYETGFVAPGSPQ